MAGFIQNYVMGMVQNAATGAATYAITTGGRYVGDAVIGAGDLIEGAGRNVGNGVEGYIDRYGNWIRSYGDAAIASTAASSGSTPVKPVKGGAAANKKKALPSSKTPKALPAPPGKPGLKRSQSDSKSPLSYDPSKALPSSGVKKALPPATGKGGGTEGLSKGQLAKLRGIRAEDLKKGTDGAKKGADGVNKSVGAVGGGVNKGAGAVGGGVNKGVGAVGGGVNKGVGAVGGGLNKIGQGVNGGANKKNEAGKKDAPGKPAYSASVAGDGAAAAKKPSTGGATGQKGQQYPKPFSPTRADGKVVISRQSKPGAAKPSGGAGSGAGKKDGVKKDDQGGIDFMRMYAEDPKKKGPGSVAGSVKTNASKKAGGGKKDKKDKQETSGKYDFF
ncbi:hypothetical protein UCDDS831_g06997 [Diplodia seriata]|uniref:Uncharacterized protein n=1 Tax=Diplodia seriata TaxID=420778 RepID=A0A0G2FXH4_9PEZI|nr:hypothetical protein UCDDS831_g06997 [Diplodia seriata]